MIQEPKFLSKEKEGPKPDVREDRDDPEGQEEGQRVKRPEPTRYGDWEKGGRCIDF